MSAIPIEHSLHQSLKRLKEIISIYFEEISQEEKKESFSEAYGAGYQNAREGKEQFQVRLANKTLMKWPQKMNKQDTDGAVAAEFQKLCISAFVQLQALSKEYLLSNFTKEESQMKLLNALDSIDLEDEHFVSSSLLLFSKHTTAATEPSQRLGSGLLTLSLLVDSGLEVYDNKTSTWVNPLSQESATTTTPESKNSEFSAIALLGESLGFLLTDETPRPHATSYRVPQSSSSSKISIVFKCKARPEVIGPRTDSDYQIVKYKMLHSKLHQPKGKVGVLPHEILISIFQFMTPKEATAIGLVSRDWYAVAISNALWQKFTLARWQVNAAEVKHSWKEMYFKMAIRKAILVKFGSYQKRQPSSTYQPPAKIVAVGDTHVGKTSYFVTFSTKAFPEAYVPRVFDGYSCSINVDGISTAVGLWDTVGNHEYSRLRPLSYIDTGCFLVAFSIEDRSSFENVEKTWVPEIRTHCQDTPFVLLGLKSDLKGEKEQIQLEEAVEMSKRIGAAAYFEVSAKDNKQVDESLIFACKCAVFPILPQSSASSTTSCSSDSKKCTVM